MNDNKNQKIIKTILSLTISFLIIFIVAMFARAASDTILPQNSAASLFINDYLDMMKQRIDKIAVGMKIKRNSVSQYQVNLITQSISDYVGYNMYQTSDTLKNYDPNKSPTKAQLDKYKNDYYRMTVENPYLKGMTVFDMNGKMMLNLYLSRNKSWPLELQNNLINEIKQKGSLVLNASNENAFYIMEYIKNDNGEMIVTTRNDYSYVSDIAMYYQVADKSLFVSDSRNSVYNVKEPIGNNLEKVSSVINRYAYYKKQPSFVVNDSLTVSMITKEYSNYFELIVLAITALLILACQLVIKGIIAFFKYLMQIKTNRDYVKNVQGDDELINDNIVNAALPVSNTHEEMPPMIQKVHYNIPNEYLKEKKENEKNEEFNIGKDILNIVANIKEEINNCRNKFSITKDDLKKDINKEENKEEDKIEIQNEEIKTVSILEEDKTEDIPLEENKLEIQEEELKTVNILEEVENEVDNELNNKEEELTISEYEKNKYDYDKYAPSYYDKEDEEKEIENMFTNVSEELKNNTDENESIVIENIAEESEKETSNYETTNSDYRKINEEDIFNKKIVKENLLLSHKEKEEEKNKEYAKSLFNKKTDSYIKSDSNNAAKDILNSYNKAVESMDLKAKEESSESLEKTTNSRTDDVFAAFDKMLSSIISKAEEDARNSITKK
ncbi:hypothetical protein [Brachyspira alvinipulli]|uniref:hypothetical protein n=1 Tax=Brachyspira alvinipulli TaxID=84379 RepID=UPI00048316A2|nr:hypothetical protein [Brachyspira alvinipulli]